MRFKAYAGTALTTVLAGLTMSGAAHADAAKIGPKQSARDGQTAALIQQLEQSRLQTALLTQIIGEFCNETDAELASCALVSHLTSTGTLDTSNLSFTAPPAA